LIVVDHRFGVFSAISSCEQLLLLTHRNAIPWRVKRGYTLILTEVMPKLTPQNMVTWSPYSCTRIERNYVAIPSVFVEQLSRQHDIP